MAVRRMFSLNVVDSDAFLDMPLTSQALYFHLSMKADDDGFVNSPKKIQRLIGATDGDAEILVTRKFIIPFQTGVIVIRHWRLNNYLRADRYNPTVFQAEKSMLSTDENGAYFLDGNKVGIPMVDQRYPQIRLDKDSKDKNSNSSFKKDSSNNFSIDISYIPSTDEQDNINRFVEIFNSIDHVTPCTDINTQTRNNISDILMSYDPFEITTAFRHLAVPAYAMTLPISLDWFADMGNFRKVFEGNV